MTSETWADDRPLAGAAPPPSIEEAAWRVLAAIEYKRDATNGSTHPGEPHDTYLHFDPCTNLPGVEHLRDLVGDCSKCAGQQYGADDLENAAWGDLRAALGLDRYQWQPAYDAQAFVPFLARLRAEGAPVEDGSSKDRPS